MKKTNICKLRFAKDRLGWLFIALASVCLSAPSAAVAEDGVLRVTAVGAAPAAENDEGGILAKKGPRASAAGDFHEFTCAFNSDGGMLTAMMTAALGRELPQEAFRVSIDASPDAQAGALSGEEGRMSFPWYRPNCASEAFLTEYTKSLCREFQWSEPLYEMLVGYFSAADYDRPLHQHHDVYGATLCLAGQEFSQMLHEVGLSDLNTRLVFRQSPAGCLDAVAKRQADLTLLPISMAALEMEHLGLEDKIIPHFNLDRVMTLHAIAPLGSSTASDDIALLNQGLAKIRADGEWFQIVKRLSKGHAHDHPYKALTE